MHKLSKRDKKCLLNSGKLKKEAWTFLIEKNQSIGTRNLISFSIA
jgi:hypothetical protein